MRPSLLESRGAKERSGVAICDAASGRSWTHAELEPSLASCGQWLDSDPQVVFCFCNNSVGSLFAYLTCFERGVPVALLDGSLDDGFRNELVDRYRPKFIVAPRDVAFDPALYAPAGAEIEDSMVWRRREDRTVEIHPELAVLLPTSGTTGNPKFVRLSRTNVVANANSIRLGLAIQPDERAILSLPLHYSYGLSVVNSHLLAGASQVVSTTSVASREFWDTAKTYAVTSMAGVPYTYQMLRRLGLNKVAPASLRTLTQAGGRLSPELIREFHQLMTDRDGRFFVMYGQTEATARIAIVPAERLSDKIGSAGLPVEGGSILILDDAGNKVGTGEQGEIVYEGPNVMLGYAERPEDLALGDVMRGRLHTGDLGYLDADGFLFITGRASRFAKVFGLRVNLDDIEKLATGGRAVAAIAGDDRVIVFAEGAPEQSLGELRAALARKLQVHATAFDIRAIERLPLLTSGKVDYKALQRLK